MGKAVLILCNRLPYNGRREYKMNEICEMGQNPLQLFIKPHIKKERHQKNLAFS